MPTISLRHCINNNQAMDYSDIPDEYRKYVKESAYEKLDDGGKEVYLRAIRHATKKFMKQMDELVNSHNMKMCMDLLKITPLYTEISFVGIEGRRRHTFDSDTEVKLERDDENPENSNAIKVLVNKNDKWKHVAYVEKDDAMELRKYGKYENKRLKFLRQYQTSARYRIFIGV